MSQRVAIIGAGICGLAALKEVLAEDLDAVCFEARDGLGGAWMYQAEVDPAAPAFTTSSIYLGTMMNSCRDTSAYSDFPLDPARYPDYFSHRMLLQYLREYAAHFGLAKHVRLQTTVVRCEPQEDGSWEVTSTGPDGQTATEAFSAVIVAGGHLNTPQIPTVDGSDLFSGQTLHSHVYRTPAPFQGKRVAVVGFGSSAVDLACEIAPHAQSLHLVTRRGGWVLPRFVLGKPAEAFDNRATQLWVPSGLSQWLQTKLLEFVQGAAPPEMQPDHKILEQNPPLRGDFLEKVMMGLITVERGDVVRMTKGGVVVKSTAKVKDKDVGTEYDLGVDVVIWATGYEMFDLPYLPPNVVHAQNSTAIELYRLIHPLHHRNLFFHGYVELQGPLPPAAEAQARYTAALLAGRVPAPTLDQMCRGIDRLRAYQHRHFVHSDRYAATHHQIPYVDELLEALDAVPTFPRLLGQVFSSGQPLRALSVLNAVWFGIPSSAMWRLVGHGAKPDLASATMIRTAAGKPALSEREVIFLDKEKME